MLGWSCRLWLTAKPAATTRTTAAAADSTRAVQRRLGAALIGVTFGGSCGSWSAAARTRARSAGGGVTASLAPIVAAASCSSRTSSRQAWHSSRWVSNAWASSTLSASTA